MLKLISGGLCAATLALGATAAAAPAAPAAPATWKIDTAHSAVTFKVKHMMVSDARGTFTGVDGKLTMDPADPTKGSVEATIDVGSVDTGDDKRDGHLKSPDFFDTA